MTEAAHQVQPRASFIIGREELLERSVQSCLESVGICLLVEWDVWAFVYRHRASLASADQIARLIGYESTVVGGALERLEREKLIERSRPSQGAQLCRIPAWTDAERWRSLQQLLSLSETRAGRLLLARLLRPVRTRLGQEEQSTESRK
jgi:DNA-binding transcriptional ArsR family regulator